MRVFVFLFISLLLPPFVAQAQSTGEAMEPQSDAAAQPAQPAGEAMPETEAQQAESEVDELGERALALSRVPAQGEHRRLLSCLRPIARIRR